LCTRPQTHCTASKVARRDKIGSPRSDTGHRV
jgi:hypothetical protein